MATDRGCSEGFSTEAATCSSSSSVIPIEILSVTRGLASVTVPVLSSTTVWALPSISRLSADLMRMPL